MGAVSAQVLHSFIFDFVPRKQEALVHRERVRSVGVGKRGGLLVGFVFGPPKVGLQRADEDLDVRVLHVRVLAGSIFVVWVPGSMAPSLLDCFRILLEFRLSHHCTTGLDRAPCPLPSLLSPARRPSPCQQGDGRPSTTQEKQPLV